MTANVFEKVGEGDPTVTDPSAAQPITSTVVAPSIPPELSEFIGEGKKYATVEAALKSIPHAQAHIQKLEQETADLRARKTDVEEILATVGKNSSSSGETPDVDEDVVAERVLMKLSAKEQERVASDNLQLASDALTKKAGSVEAAAIMVIEKAKELGLQPDDLQRLAKKSPAAFLAYFTETTPKTDDVTPGMKGKVNTEALSAGATKVEQGTFAWYQQQRKTRGDSWYFSEAATKARLADAARLGNNKFFGR